MIVPPKLVAGDTIGIVAPARKITLSQLEPAIEKLEAWGLETVMSKNIFSTAHSYLAGSDAERQEDFQRMLDDPKIKAVFCARGGYGSTRIIEGLDFSSLVKNPKWIIGFSDVTAFHLQLLNQGIVSIHGTMPIFFGREESEVSVESIRKIILDGSCKIEFQPEAANRPGVASGPVIGGNLSLIADALDTPSAPDTNGKILVVEEVDEYYYKLDRMFTQLRRTGKLKNLAGLLIGHMTDIKNSELDFGETVFQIVSYAVRDYQYPVAFSFPSGHQDPNLAWVHGANGVLEISSLKVTLSYPNIYSPNE